jgi:hypothetical protein
MKTYLRLSYFETNRWIFIWTKWVSKTSSRYKGVQCMPRTNFPGVLQLLQQRNENLYVMCALAYWTHSSDLPNMRKDYRSHLFLTIIKRDLFPHEFIHLRFCKMFDWSRDGLLAGRSWFNSRQCKIFLFSTESRRFPVQWVPEALSSGGGGKATRAWSWLVRRSRKVQLCLHSWHSTQLSTETILFLLLRLYKCIVTFRPVAKRWLCKQRPLLGNARNMYACNNKTKELRRPFLQNGSVNTRTSI